jgi:hypothetical protein
VACCTNGICTILNPSLCQENNGTAVGGVCATDTCERGACCVANTCIDTELLNCQGQFIGANVTCSPGLCDGKNT